LMCNYIQRSPEDRMWLASLISREPTSEQHASHYFFYSG
jgi:hypothetical protein